MVPIQIVFLVTAILTIAAGFGAAVIAMCGNTRSNASQRIVVKAFAQIALLGASAITALLALPI
jgi:hypothetical protein